VSATGKLIASYVDLVIPVVLAALVWWRLWRIRRAIFKPGLILTLTLSIAATVVLFIITYLPEFHPQFKPFPEFFPYYAFLLIFIGGGFLYLHSIAYPSYPGVSRLTIWSELLFTVASGFSVCAIPLVLIISPYLDIHRAQWLQFGLIVLGVTGLPLALLFVLRIISNKRRRIPEATSQSARAIIGTFILLTAVIVSSAGIVQFSFQEFVPPRLAKNAWLLDLDFDTGLSAGKLNRRIWAGEKANAELVRGLIEAGHEDIFGEFKDVQHRANAAFRRGSTTVVVYEVGITIFKAIIWEDRSDLGLPVNEMDKPISLDAFQKRFGRGSRVKGTVDPYRPYSFFGLNPSSPSNTRTISYETGSLGLHTMTLSFEDNRLVATRYFPRHHDVIAPWEMPWFMAPGFLIPSILAVLLVAFLFCRSPGFRRA